MSLSRAVLVLGLGLAAAGCRSGNSGGTCVDLQRQPPKASVKVATFGKDAITVEDVERRLAALPAYGRARYQTPEQKREFVDGLARFELFAAEALRRGLQNDPDVVEAARKVMVQKLVQKEFEGKTAAPSEEEINAYYQSHRSDYVKPEMVRLYTLFLAAPTATDRARRKPEVEAALKKVQALERTDFAGFGRLAKELSEDPRSKALNGDLRFISEEELKAQYGPKVAEAAAALRQMGDVSPPVETDQGIYILKLQSRQAALNLTPEQVKQQIQGRIQSERRQQNYEQFLAGLKKNSNFQIDEKALAAVKVDAAPPASHGSTTSAVGGAGMVPHTVPSAPPAPPTGTSRHPPVVPPTPPAPPSSTAAVPQ